jgi:hypothetical protein
MAMFLRSPLGRDVLFPPGCRISSSTKTRTTWFFWSYPRAVVTAEQIIGKLREAEVGLAQGRTVPDVSRKLTSEDVLERLSDLFVVAEPSGRGRRDSGDRGDPLAGQP